MAPSSTVVVRLVDDRRDARDGLARTGTHPAAMRRRAHPRCGPMPAAPTPGRTSRRAWPHPAPEDAGRPAGPHAGRGAGVRTRRGCPAGRRAKASPGPSGRRPRRAARRWTGSCRCATTCRPTPRSPGAGGSRWPRGGGGRGGSSGRTRRARGLADGGRDGSAGSGAAVCGPTHPGHGRHSDRGGGAGAGAGHGGCGGRVVAHGRRCPRPRTPPTGIAAGWRRAPTRGPPPPAGSGIWPSPSSASPDPPTRPRTHGKSNRQGVGGRLDGERRGLSVRGFRPSRASAGRA